MADLTREEELALAEAGVPKSRWPVALRAFRHRDFGLFWIGMLVSVMGTWMQTIAQGWLVLHLRPENPSFYLGLVGMCGTLPMLLFTLPAGVVADRVRKRNLVLLTQTLAMLQAFALAILIYAGVVRVWHVMVLAACLGAINAFDMPTRQAMTLELVTREDAINAVSINSSAFNMGRIVGPAVAGVIIMKAGIAGCFLINALSFLAIIVALAVIPARPAATKRRGQVWEDVAEGVRWARRQPVARALLLLTAVSGIFAMPYTTLMPVFASNIFHTDARGYGLLMLSVGVGALCAAALLASTGHRWRLGSAATLGSIFFPLGLLGLSCAPTYLTAMGTLFLIGLGLMTFNAVSNSMLQTAPPDALRGRVMSLRAFVFAGMSPIGAFQIGVVASGLGHAAARRFGPDAAQYGPRGAVAIGAVMCLLAALLVLWRVPRVRKSKHGL